jgi:23S rRNA (adenine2030-N6)-methyltransferase
MLSYQHGYHAGNFADVHKHTALCLLLDHFASNKKIVTYLDSHAGRGFYDLNGEQSEKTSEWKDGFGKLTDQSVTTKGLKLYTQAVAHFQESHTATSYPGSPALTQLLMQDNHHGVFFELHPAEFECLKENLGSDKRLRIVYKDVQNHLADFMPNRTQDGLLLIDPSYEIKDDYTTIAKLTTFAHKRWKAAVIMIWYPMLPEKRHEDLKANLKGATFYELIGPMKERGMYGTGLAVINAPEGFDGTFVEAADEMKAILFK